MIHAVGIPLPATVFDLMGQRKGKFEPAFNDYVEQLHLRLFDNVGYKNFLEAVIDGEAQEGSLSCDDHEAARILRELARKENSPFKDKTIASYKLALKVVMRRYQMTRKERAITLGGELVAAE